MVAFSAAPAEGVVVFPGKGIVAFNVAVSDLVSLAVSFFTKAESIGTGAPAAELTLLFFTGADSEETGATAA